MYKLCKTAQSAQRQRELELGLQEAMKVQRYEDISICDLCTKLSIPRKTFYRYFDSKDGALYGLIDHTLMDHQCFDLVEVYSGKRSLLDEMERFFMFWQEKKGLLDALRLSGLSGILIERAIGFALSDAMLPQRFLQESSEALQQHITTFTVCGTLSMVLSWHENGFRETPAELAAITSRLLSQPLFLEPDSIP